MNPDWQNLLQRQHASMQDGVVLHFGDAQAELMATQHGTVLCDLSQFGIIKIYGEDAQSFLQNMFSSDVGEVSAQQAQFSSLNTPKGRMLATFLIWQTDADYFLHLPHALCASICKRLSMYVLRSKVKVEDASNELVCLGLSGAGASTLLQQHFGSAPQNLLAAEEHDTASILCVGKQRYQIICTPQYAPALWQNFAMSARAVGSVCWDWINICSGIPIVSNTTQEQFVPQMANLELIGGVNFKKGCYPGQEIVARMQYRGKTKRRMYLAHLACIAQAGDELFSVATAEHACGMVVNAAPAPGGGFDLLAVMRIESHDTQSVHIGSLQGEALQFRPLPYTIPA